MAVLIGVAGAAKADVLVERAAIPALTRPWESLCVSHDVSEGVALAFGGERGGLYVDTATGVRAVLDGELFSDGAILSGTQGARRIVERYVRAGERFDPGDGWFAAAIWDPRERLVVLVSDLMGHRPLYVARRHGAILIASQLKSLVAAGLEPKLDLQAWAEMLDYENPLGDRTSAQRASGSWSLLRRSSFRSAAESALMSGGATGWSRPQRRTSASSSRSSKGFSSRQ